MASIVSTIFGGSALQGLAEVINAIKGKNPEDAARLQELTLKYQSDFANAQLALESKKLDAQTSQDSTAGENVRAEITSVDPVVRRARSMPLWIGTGAIFINYCILPFARIWKSFDPIALPAMFWYTYMFAIGGYVGHSMIDRAMGGEGGTMTLGLTGVNATSKGDKS